MIEWTDDGDSEDLIFKINNKGSESIIYTADNNQVTFLCDPSRFDLWRSILRFRYFALGENCTSISWIDYYFVKYHDGKQRLVPYEPQPEFKDTFPNITVHLRPPDLQQTTLRLQKEINGKIQNLIIHMYPTTSNFLIQGGACNKWVVYEFMILCKAVDCLERGVASAHLNINFRALPTFNPTESCLSKLELLEQDSDIETKPNDIDQAIDRGQVSCLDDMADSSFENELDLELSYFNNVATEPPKTKMNSLTSDSNFNNATDYHELDSVISDDTLEITTDICKRQEVTVSEPKHIINSSSSAEMIDLIDLYSEIIPTNCINTPDHKPKDLNMYLQVENTDVKILSCGANLSNFDDHDTSDNTLTNNSKNIDLQVTKDTSSEIVDDKIPENEITNDSRGVELKDLRPITDTTSNHSKESELNDVEPTEKHETSQTPTNVESVTISKDNQLKHEDEKQDKLYAEINQTEVAPNDTQPGKYVLQTTPVLNITTSNLNHTTKSSDNQLYVPTFIGLNHEMNDHVNEDRTNGLVMSVQETNSIQNIKSSITLHIKKADKVKHYLGHTSENKTNTNEPKSNYHTASGTLCKTSVNYGTQTLNSEEAHKTHLSCDVKISQGTQTTNNQENNHSNCYKEIETLRKMIFNLQLQLCEISDTCNSINLKINTSITKDKCELPESNPDNHLSKKTCKRQ